MQTVKEIQALLDQADARPLRRLGQCFLIDLNQMRKLLEIAGLSPGCSDTVLEVGPGTGSLTEELQACSAKVVAVEIDRRLAGLLRARLIGESGQPDASVAPPGESACQHPWRVDRSASEKIVLIEGDILASKSIIAPPVLAELGHSARMVANLPYSIATSLVAECMLESWRAVKTRRGVRFDSLTFTVQQEVAQRFAATAGRQFGPVSVILSLLGKVSLGPTIPASSFWPRPKIASQIVRIDFDAAAAEKLDDAATLQALLSMTFTQRRKRISSTAKGRGAPFAPEVFANALAAANIDPASRADQISPKNYLTLANILAATMSTSMGN